MVLSRRKVALCSALGLSLVMLWSASDYRSPWVDRIKIKVLGKKTIEQRIEELGPRARGRLKARFERAQVSYPPYRLRIVAFKDERLLELYAQDGPREPWQHVASHALRGYSGVLGPKLKEGDRQIPEGKYRLIGANPNSAYHVSLKVSYPSPEDRAQARREGRTRLGDDIFIHGGALSMGCLAVGGEVAEDLFVLAHDTDFKAIEVWISPIDFRQQGMPEALQAQPKWVLERYQALSLALGELPL